MLDNNPQFSVDIAQCACVWACVHPLFMIHTVSYNETYMARLFKNVFMPVPHKYAYLSYIAVIFFMFSYFS